MMLQILARAKDGEGVKSGPLGLAIILVLCVACYFLFKSMSKHMKRVREEFPTDLPVRGAPTPQPTPPADGAAPVAGSGAPGSTDDPVTAVPAPPPDSA